MLTIRQIFGVLLVLLVGKVQVFGQCIISVETRPQPIQVECTCDIEDINPLFLDSESNNDEDLIALEALGFSVTSTGNCGILLVSARDFENHPTSCADSYFLERRYQIFSMNGGVPHIFIDTFVTEFIPPHFLEKAQDVEITCKENIDSSFQDFKDNFSFTEFLDCYPETSAQYTPDIDPLLVTLCGGTQFVRALIQLTGPCFNKCDSIGKFELAQTISNFEVLDDFQAQITCPDSPVSIDISDPLLEEKITALLDDYDLSFGCFPPIVSNDFEIDSIDSLSCPIDGLPITIFATEGCQENSGTCTFVVDLVITYYGDKDGDGFGNENEIYQECIQPANTSTIAGDCDDNNPSINPAAIETSNNGIDENCDGFDGTTSNTKLAGLRLAVNPNPTSDYLNVDTDLTGVYYLVYDTTGKLLDEGLLEGNVITLKGLPKGILLLRFRNGNSELSGAMRVVKI